MKNNFIDLFRRNSTIDKEKRNFILEHTDKNYAYLEYLMNLKNITKDTLEKLLKIDENFFQNLEDIKFYYINKTPEEINLINNFIIEMNMNIYEIREKFGYNFLNDDLNQLTYNFYTSIKNSNIINKEETYKVASDPHFRFFENMTFDAFSTYFVNEENKCILTEEILKEIKGKNNHINKNENLTKYQLLDNYFLKLCKDKWYEYYIYLLKPENKASFNLFKTIIDKKEHEKLEVFINMGLKKLEYFNINPSMKEYILDKNTSVYLSNQTLGTNNFFKRCFSQDEFRNISNTYTDEMDILKILVEDISKTGILKENEEFALKYSEVYEDLITLTQNSQDITKLKEIIAGLQEKYKEKNIDFGKMVTELENDYKKSMQDKFLKEITQPQEDYKIETSKTGKQYKVKYYNGEDFTMLVHVVSASQGKDAVYASSPQGQRRMAESGKYAREMIENPTKYMEKINNPNFTVFSMSLIDQDYMKLYRYDPIQDIVLGFEGFDPNKVILTNSIDTGVTNSSSEEELIKLTNRDLVEQPYTTTITSAKNIMDTTKERKTGLWNEVDVLAQNLMPSYVLVFNEPTEQQIAFASTYDIPIRVINIDKYKNTTGIEGLKRNV